MDKYFKQKAGRTWQVMKRTDEDGSAEVVWVLGSDRSSEARCEELVALLNAAYGDGFSDGRESGFQEGGNDGYDRGLRL